MSADEDRHVPACRCIWCASDPDKAELAERFYRQPETRAGAIDELAATLTPTPESDTP